MKSTFAFVVTVGTLFPMTGSTQDSYPHNGTWKVSYFGAKGAERTGKIMLNNKAGEWDMIGRNTKDPCSGRPSPVEVQTATADELIFQVKTSQALQGCDDSLVTLKRIDVNKLEGEITQPGEPGKKITLVRD